MLYLNEEHIRTIGLNWRALVDTMQSAATIMDAGRYVQPLKTYLRYRNPKNRIIAMPAYIGEPLHAAGIKWIASFPDNIHTGLPRAHSVIILNDPETGKPGAILNTALPSGIRTASVSGLMLRCFLQTRPAERLSIGIIGWGPIGRLHYRMCCNLFEEQIDQIYLYDIRGIDETEIPSAWRGRTQIVSDWKELYTSSSICITCTVADERYIDAPPQKGSLLLDVSLRDYTAGALDAVRAIIVDDWKEVCRENTDIELLHRERGLTSAGTRTLADVVCRSALSEFEPEETVLFCPMGMAAFDIATAAYYVKQAQLRGIGIELE